MRCSSHLHVIAGTMLVATLAASTRAAARMPPAIATVLGRVQGDIIRTLLGAPPPASQKADPSVAARMERARQADVIAAGNDAMFDDANVRLGVWASDVFLSNYGTALFLTAPYDDERTPIFLVHGVNSSPRDLAILVSRLRASRYQPVLFYYPTGISLAEASHELGVRMQEFLRRHPTARFAVVGHSMGGLLVKGMVDQFDVARIFPGWTAFIGLSCPWSGVPAAAHANRLPVHPPAWDDLAPTSGFIRRVNATPFPRRLAFYMFFGARGRPSIFSVLGNNDGRLTIDSMMDTPLAASARDTFGFYEDHASILVAPRVLERLQTVLDHELG